MVREDSGKGSDELVLSADPFPFFRRLKGHGEGTVFLRNRNNSSIHFAGFLLLAAKLDPAKVS